MRIIHCTVLNWSTTAVLQHTGDLGFTELTTDVISADCPKMLISMLCNCIDAPSMPSWTIHLSRLSVHSAPIMHHLIPYRLPSTTKSWISSDMPDICHSEMTRWQPCRTGLKHQSWSLPREKLREVISSITTRCVVASDRRCTEWLRTLRSLWWGHLHGGHANSICQWNATEVLAKR